MMMLHTNLHIYPSNLKNESRLFKEANTLLDHNLVKKIIAVGLKDNSTSKTETRRKNFKIIRINIRTIFKQNFLQFLFQYFFFQVIVFIKFLNHQNIDVINAHNLSVLPVSVLLKLTKKAKLIYDPHELETEVYNAKGVKKKFGKWVEKKLIVFADEIIVVNESIKNWYSKEYDLENIYVVRNVPNTGMNENKLKPKSKFRYAFNISKDDIIFLYQGLISSARGIDIILEAFKNADNNKVLVLMGFGPDVERIKTEIENYPNIFYHKAVSKNVLNDYTRSADVGFSLIENSCLNHYYCLPNKAFEYLFSGLPQITSNFPELKKLVCDNDFGWCIDPNPLALERLIQKINKESIKVINDKIFHSKKFYGWEKEQNQIIRLYKNLVND